MTGGWCSGTLGCEKLCETEIVYTGREEYTTFSSEQINELATQLKVDDENDPNFDFKCGCSSNREGMPCDGDFDGKFKGACSENSCGGRQLDAIQSKIFFSINLDDAIVNNPFSCS